MPSPRQTPLYTAHFAAGPRLFHPGLGMLPGPPTLLVPAGGRGPALLVDDRNAGTTIEQGPHRARLVTTAEALALLVAATRPVALPQGAPPTPLDAEPVAGLRQAAQVLRAGRATLSSRIQALAPAQRPANTGSADRPRWWWPSREACRAWWQAVNQPAPAPAAPSSASSASSAQEPRPPARSSRPTQSLVQRLAALEAQIEP